MTLGSLVRFKPPALPPRGLQPTLSSQRAFRPSLGSVAWASRASGYRVDAGSA